MKSTLAVAVVGILALAPLAACAGLKGEGSSPPNSPAPGVTGNQPAILNYTGHGNGSTPDFTLSTSGTYDVYWTFSGNDKPQAQSVANPTGDAFNIQQEGVVQQVGGDGFANMLVAPSGSGSTEVNGGPGSGSLMITADPDCTWTVTVTSMQP